MTLWPLGSSSVSAVARPLLLAVSLYWIPSLESAAEASDLRQFLGIYVGEAIVEDLTTGKSYERHLDIEVTPYHQDGLRIDWVTVELVNGMRDQPGVKRWSQEARFKPSESKGFLVEVGENDVFRERQAMVPIEGDPVRWTRIDDNSLHTSSFVVTEDGRYELQLYQRILTDIGMDIQFERIVDGKTVRRAVGRTARTQ